MLLRAAWGARPGARRHRPGAREMVGRPAAPSRADRAWQACAAGDRLPGPARPMSERYFEDYPPGALFEGGAVAVSEGDILEFARRYDPQTMHTDPAVAAHGYFGGLIASGWHTAALMMRLFAA